MSGRAVGGAAGAGCGVFSLLGVLLAVGLTVWLASQATSSSDVQDEAADQAAELGMRPEDAAALAADGRLPTEAAGTTVSVTDDGGLDDGESVFVDGAGFAPGPVDLVMCLTGEARLADGLAGCDPDTSMPTEVGPDGVLDAGYQVRRVITVADVAYDCAASRGACELVASPPGELAGAPSAALAFTEGLPAVDAIAPGG
ncbi:MAG: hypothetical protein KDA97_03020 [Acidimicrobiales bacterium]|nr:hypothetical protein [Acidimicrobiales bacterium]